MDCDVEAEHARRICMKLVFRLNSLSATVRRSQGLRKGYRKKAGRKVRYEAFSDMAVN